MELQRIGAQHPKIKQVLAISGTPRRTLGK